MGKLKELLESTDYLILDGALGTELENRGHDVSGKLWSAKYLLENPQIIQELHEDYLRSGADIVTTSSYQATVQGLEDYGLSEKEALDTIALTVELAKNARQNFWQSLSDDEKKKRVYPLIAGDVGPYAAYLADGSEYTGDYQLSKESFKDFHRSRIQTLLAAGSDFLAIETIPNMTEATALVELLADEFPDTEAYMSFTAQDSQSISDGTLMTEVAKLCDSSKQILAFGINCSRPAIISDLLKASRTISQKPLVTYPNSGEIYDGAIQTWKSLPDNSHTLCENSQVWHKLGAKIVGGCCRTRPEDIKLLADKLK